MIGRVRKHRSFTDDVDPDRLSVFIPGAIASGFLISIGLLVGDALRKIRGGAGIRRRVMLTGDALADEIRGGAGAARANATGLRPRAMYGITGSVFLGLAVGAIPGASWNFLNPVGYIENIAWIWAVSMLSVVVFVPLGVLAIRLAPEWLPIFFLAMGAILVIRFAIGSESAEVRILVIALSAAVSALTAALTWKLRRLRHVVDVPPAARRLLASTPLGRTPETDV
ncbi:MAG: hypothetical protein ACE5GC_06685 [Acidimicrobiia bacterium]